ncbi:MAG: radical SAM protein [Deltaproteobacteria bacterium]|nr:radical SAM protein [Deltaproteobacteria bacterium]
MEHVVLCTRSAPAPFGGTAPVVPLATRTLATYLRRRLRPDSCRITVVDFPVSSSPEQMLATLAPLAPDVVALSCYVWNYAAHYELCDLVGQHVPQTAIVLGGPQVSYDAEDLERLIARHPAIGVVVQGEGEHALLDYLDAPRSRRPGGGAVVAGRPLDDLDAVGGSPFAAYPPGRAVQTLNIETQRGCPHRCAFCSVPLAGPRLRKKSRTLVEEELRWAVANAVVNADFADASVNLDQEHMAALLDAINAADPEATLYNSVEVDHRCLTAEQAKRLSRIRGRVGMGLQSVGAAANHLMHRRLDRRAFARAVGWLRAAGLNVTLEFILGLPGDTIDDMRATAEFALSLDGVVVASVLRVLPGSEFYHRRHEYALAYDEADGHRLISSRWLSADELARACEEFRERAEAATAGGRRGRVRFWDHGSVDLSQRLLDRGAEDDLGRRAAAFLARFPGMRVEGTELEDWGGTRALVCRLRLRNGETFRLGFAGAHERLDALFEAEGCCVTYVSTDGAPPSPTVRQALGTLQQLARQQQRATAGPGDGGEGQRS